MESLCPAVSATVQHLQGSHGAGAASAAPERHLMFAQSSLAARSTRPRPEKAPAERPDRKLVSPPHPGGSEVDANLTPPSSGGRSHTSPYFLQPRAVGPCEKGASGVVGAHVGFPPVGPAGRSRHLSGAWGPTDSRLGGGVSMLITCQRVTGGAIWLQS